MNHLFHFLKKAGFYFAAFLFVISGLIALQDYEHYQANVLEAGEMPHEEAFTESHSINSDFAEIESNAVMVMEESRQQDLLMETFIEELSDQITERVIEKLQAKNIE